MDSSCLTPTVTFDVGGKIYKVSRSLLNRYPDSMLARMAAKEWQQQQGHAQQQTPLFIERDGQRFRYVLDYMRDGRVILPMGKVTKEALWMDLQYYGLGTSTIDANESSCISCIVDDAPHMYNCFVQQSIHDHKKACRETVSHYYAMLLALKISLYMDEKNISSVSLNKIISGQEDNGFAFQMNNRYADRRGGFGSNTLNLEQPGGASLEEQAFRAAENTIDRVTQSNSKTHKLFLKYLDLSGLEISQKDGSGNNNLYVSKKKE